ncbi:MAG: L,D-transpeptidase family protein [Brumimicrobium sp.]|nr:L,D-transpeptidase family protein [Brumimicrobium sp.]MCO5267970.1 L,D-transpeptidase family protein [Brumimicrobium sp.]
MRYIFLLLGCLLFSFVNQIDFLTEQKKYTRVRTAITEKEILLKDKLNTWGLEPNNLHILFVAYKDDDILEVYGKRKSEENYKKLFSYAICSRSGKLGPKRKEGDGQVPEGFYLINRFNPVSNFYLSLGLNYPNLSDKRKSVATKLGGDIFIHGGCVTIGCLPMTDDKIKEIYLLAAYAKNNGQSQIPIYIFPFQMTDNIMLTFRNRYADNPNLISFWENLKTGYDIFQRDKKALRIQVKENGDYTF